MLKNYLKTALRRFWRQRAFTIINILGLSTGLSIALVMIISVKYQLSIDSFHEKAENIYAVGMEYILDGKNVSSNSCGGAWGEAIQENYPEVIMKSRMKAVGELLLTTFNEAGDIDKKYIESRGAGVDSTFFQMFTFPLLKGNAENVLKSPHSMILTKEFAQKYFANENPIGKSITINRTYNLIVTGVLEELPQNTQLAFDFYVSMEFLRQLGFSIDNIGGNTYQTFLLFEERSSLDNINSTLKDFLYAKFDRDMDYNPYLISVGSMYLYGENLGHIFIKIFSAIAIFILIMACINFMNLSTATSLQRAKEIAVRKIVGAQRRQLIRQLLSESILLAIISLNIAIVLSEFILELFDKMYGETVPLNLGDYGLWAQFIFLTLITGFLSGSYPAIFLSSFKPVKVLSMHSSKSAGGKFRKILVVFQFTLSILFLTLTINSYRQNKAILKNKIGIDTDNIVYIPVRGEITQKYDLIKEELLQNSNIINVTSSSQEPTWVTIGEFEWGITPEKNKDLSRVLWVNYDFLDAFKIKLKEGRFYSKDFPGDMENSIVINEEIVKALDIKDPIGKQFYLYEDAYTIIGVVEYFNFFPVEIGGRNLIIKPSLPENGHVYIKYKHETYPYIAEYIESVFEKYNPNYPYEYLFYSDFKSPAEEGIDNLSKQLVFFTFFGVFIAVLGLLGLSAYMVEQKTKEIGIRKAMGASVQKILSIITWQFLKLILIANIIALPIAFAIHNYVKQFLTVNTTGDSFVFVFVFIFIFILAFLIIYFVTIRAAKANPAQSLRYE